MTTIDPESTFWSENDDRILDAWIEHGFPDCNAPRHAVDLACRLRNRYRQMCGTVDELIASASTSVSSESDPQGHPAVSRFPHTGDPR